MIGTSVIPITAQDIKKTLLTIPAPNPIFKYPAYITMEIHPDDIEKLKNPIPPDTALLVRLIIGYFTVIPDWLFHLPFYRIRNLFLFGSLVIFPQRIALTVENVPSWADINFLTPNIYIEVSNTPHYSIADLIITPYTDAPAGPHAISVRACAPQMHRIEQVEVIYDTALNYVVQWIALFSIYLENATVITPPNTITNTSIFVKNHGNGDAFMNVTIPEIEGWNITTDTPCFFIRVGETKTVIIHMRPPGDFQGTQPIQLLFTPFRFNESALPLPVLLTAQYP